MFIFSVIFFLCSVNSDLAADRQLHVEYWITRTASTANSVRAYLDNVTDPSLTRVVVEAGNFAPKIIGREYDVLAESTAGFIGINILTINAIWDTYTTKYIATDYVQVDYSVFIQILNFTTFQLSPYQSFRFREVIGFLPSSDVMNLTFTYQDPDAAKLFDNTVAGISHAFICSAAFFGCNVSKPGGGTYLTDTGFTTEAECVDFLDHLALNDPCPFPQRSNTTDCRNLHALSSIALPEVHCAHVRRDSVVCNDTCLPACANCDVNAKCLGSFPDPTTSVAPHYECKCKNGYVGNGTTCTAKSCYYGNCPSLYGSYDCSTGLCMCTETFTANPVGYGTNNLCSCPTGGHIFYNGSKPICVPEGRCFQEKWECNLQAPNQVKCARYNVNNTLSLFKGCLCNYGFNGGWEYPCSCQSPKRVVWSNVFAGEVCLSTNECTVGDGWHCAYPKVCVTPSGQQIGSCL